MKRRKKEEEEKKKDPLLRSFVMVDPGPTATLFQQVQQTWKQSPSPLTLSQVLPFAQPAKFRAMELGDLIANTFPPDADRRFYITEAVIDWIYYTNKLEGAGMETLGDTEQLIRSQQPGETIKEKETVDIFYLLKETYNGLASSCAQNAFEKPNLQEWHKTLLLRSLPAVAGKFRRSGAKISTREGSEHHYPHFSVIDNGLDGLGQMSSHLGKQIDAIQGDGSKREKILYTFALAAFVHFHFVDLHPFADGNGRICRFLSKRLLDSVCPMPFPMFRDRARYLSALEAARKEQDVLFAPKKLFELLLTEAVICYAKLQELTCNQPFNYRFGADDEARVTEFMKSKGATDSEIERGVEAFRGLNEGQTVIITLTEQGSQKSVELRKLFVLFIEDFCV